jgi:hypothetical protein
MIEKGSQKNNHEATLQRGNPPLSKIGYTILVDFCKSAITKLCPCPAIFGSEMKNFDENILLDE